MRRTQAELDKLPAAAFCGPNRTYPVMVQADVKAAADLSGKAADPAAVKAKIIARVKALGLKLPEAWETGKDADKDADDARDKAKASKRGAKAREIALAILGQQRTLEAMMGGGQAVPAGADLSFDDIRTAVQSALDAESKSKAPKDRPYDYDYVYIREVFPGYAILIRKGQNFKRSYSVLDGKVTIADKEVPVKEVWVAIQEAALRAVLRTERARLAEASVERLLTEASGNALAGLAIEDAEDESPVIKGVTLISPGESINGRSYSEAVLKRDGPRVFEDAPAYVTQHIAQEQNLRNLVGVYRNVRYEDDRLKGDLHGLKSERPMLEKAVEATALMGADRVGLSINTPAKFSAKRSTAGKSVQEVTALGRDRRTAVELVMNPSAGGRLTEAADLDDPRYEGSRLGSSEEGAGLKELIARLKEADLCKFTAESMSVMTEGLSDDEIRAANPRIAEAIIALRDGAVEETEDPASKPASRKSAAGQTTESTDRATETDSDEERAQENDIRVLVMKQVDAAIAKMKRNTANERRGRWRP